MSTQTNRHIPYSSGNKKQAKEGNTASARAKKYPSQKRCISAKIKRQPAVGLDEHRLSWERRSCSTLTEKIGQRLKGTDFVLKKEDVHVFRASLQVRPEEREVFEATLSRDELLRASRFRFSQDRDYFVAARGLLRTLIGRYTGANPRGLCFRYGPYGKPFLETGPGTEPLRFNISHSHGLCLLAFSRGREVGIDGEYIRPSGPDDEDIIRRFFSPAEAAALGALPIELRQKGFFTFWARKEAYLKARGFGAAMELRNCDVSGSPDERTGLITVRGDEAASRWGLTDLDAGPEYAGALAAEGHDWQPTFREWED
jgi:4'-phosphopantetheinyl transferase